MADEPEAEAHEITIPTPPERPDAGPRGAASDTDGDGDRDGGGWSLPFPSTWPRRVGLVFLLLAVVAAGSFWYLSQPAEPAPDVDPHPAQTEIHDALDPFGYPAVLVDVTDDRALVRYEQPADLDTELAYALARDAAALHGEDTERIVVQAYEDWTPAREWTVPTGLVRDYLEGEATREDLEDGTTVREPG